MKRFLITSVFLLLLSIPVLSQTNQAEIYDAFESASAEFNVPVDILKAISFAQTRMTHMQWAEGDTVSDCSGMPRPYGIMGLWDNEIFGHSLRTAASLIQSTPEELKADLLQNIRGGAALLRSLRSQSAAPAEYRSSDLESWYPALAAFTGIPQRDLALSLTIRAFQAVERNYDLGTRSTSTLHLEPMRKELRRLREINSGSLQKNTAQPDYPGAKWVAGHAGYYYTSGNGKKFVVVHDMEATYEGVVSYFQTLADGRQVSVHYCINGKPDVSSSPYSNAPAGEITQMVEEKNYAWHAVCLNTWSLGIEHEGYVANPAWFTPEMYLSSGRLIGYMCDKYAIPKDRNHIVGHNEWANAAWNAWCAANGFPATFATCNSHTDPGSNWDWTFLMQIVTDDPTPPAVTSTQPTTPWSVASKITLRFSQRMEPVSTLANLTIAPTVAGTFAWSNNNKTLEFTPTSRYEYNTSYVVKIDTGSHNYLNRSIDGNGDGTGGDPYSFSFTTVERDSIAPTIVSIYPTENQVLSSGSGPLTITFSEYLDATSAILGNFIVREVGGDEAARVIQHWKQSNKSAINIWFYTPLTSEKQYELVMQNLKDLGGNLVASLPTVHFSVQSAGYTATVLEPFNATISGWLAPGGSGSTVGTIPESTSFAYSTARLVPILAGNTGSALLNYSWNTGNASWLIREYLSSGTPRSIVWNKAGTRLQTYLFGDGSGTNFRFAIDDSVDVFPTGQSANHEVSTWTPIDWIGWRLVEWNLESDPVGTWLGNGILEGQLRFDSYQFQYRSGISAASGQIYLDQLQIITRPVTGVPHSPTSTLPVNALLLESYPNPFNPSTTIQYTVPSTGHVKLQIFDMLGREVALLIDREEQAGSYQVEFDGSNLVSGIYFGKLTSAGSSTTHKLVLMK